jgi:Leucine-rich repeat (LRR) protein
MLGSPHDLEFAYTRLLMNEAEVKDASILANYPHLRFISLALNALRKAPWLSAMTEAVYIDLHGNSLKVLPEFDAPIPNLINFLLQTNKIRHVPVLPFPVLTRLDLSENAIRTIAPCAFAQIETLAFLKLSQNKIRQIASDTFKGLKKLERLELDNNEVRKVADDACFERN